MATECELTQEDVNEVMYMLTMQLRPKFAALWKKKGFNKINRRGFRKKENVLMLYWWNKCQTDESVMALACRMKDSQAQWAKLYPKKPPGATPQPEHKPSALQMASNLAKSMAKWAEAGFELASTEVLNRRLEVCGGCDLWDSTALGGTGRCRECGCSTQAKLRLASEKCPLDKWLPVAGPDAVQSSDMIKNTTQNSENLTATENAVTDRAARVSQIQTPKTMFNSIFVQIASYRDPELIKTLDSMFENAQHPNLLKVCIAWQHDKDESLGKYAEDSRVQIIDIPYEESEGACWARNKIQQKYNGEKYTLQIDSHMRFDTSWDTLLIELLESLRSSKVLKPLLTGYVSSYDPTNDPAGRSLVPWQMNFDMFTPEGVVLFIPGGIENYKNLKKPIPAKFYSAHFCFADGSFCTEVPHDPDYYFHGEEISISARAYTRGYDLFHPHFSFIWHEYTRNGRPKQWDDNKEWWHKNSRCMIKNRELFGMDGHERATDFGIYGFGETRTLEEYERYVGLCFKERKVHQCNITHNMLAPCDTSKMTYEEWKSTLKNRFKTKIKIPKSYLDVYDEYLFICIAFLAEDGTEICRKDIDRAELARLIEKNKDDAFIEALREFDTGVRPKRFVTWANSKTRGWLKRLESPIVD
jgi:glycosyltransferase involved in cell wall biosynthesis